MRADLRTLLLDHAVALTRELGPHALSLREVQRRSGVSPAAAYRHYRDRDALLAAVGQRASVAMADFMQRALDAAPTGRGAERDAVARLRAGLAGYLDFALAEPELFRAVFLTDEGPADLEDPHTASGDTCGPSPGQLLQQCLHGLIELGVLPEAEGPWSDTTVWAGCHGLAVLLLDGPLRRLDDTQKQAAAHRLLDVLVTGLTSSRAL